MKNSKAIKRQLLAAVAMVIVAAVALGSSTYAWFINNAQVTATDVSVTASTAYSLLIKGSGDDAGYATTTALNANQILTPVSTIGTVNSATKEVEFWRSDKWNGAGEVYEFKATTSTDKVTTDNDAPTYFYKDTVYLKAGQASKIYLDNTTTGIASTADGNITVKKFDAVTDAKDLALLETMRVGFMVTQGEGDSATRKFYVYQLNATSSGTGKAYNTSINQADGLQTATNSANSVTAITFENLDAGKTKVLTDAAMAAGAQNAFATVSGTPDVLAEVAADEEIQVDIYIWMEGCDYDTTAANSAYFAASISGIQFGFCVGAPASAGAGA